MKGKPEGGGGSKRSYLSKERSCQLQNPTAVLLENMKVPPFTCNEAVTSPMEKSSPVPPEFLFYMDKGDLRLGFTSDLEKVRLEWMRFKANKKLKLFLIGKSCIKAEMQLVCCRFFEQQHRAGQVNVTKLCLTLCTFRQMLTRLRMVKERIFSKQGLEE